MQILTPILVVSILATNILAHPGDDHSAEVEERAAFTKFSKKDLSHCAQKIKARGIEARALARRKSTVQEARKKRGHSTTPQYLRARADAIDTDHQSSIDYDSNTAASTLFASNSSCILSPEVTQGPYWVEGEYMRKDVRETQAGLELILDAQILDITTCEPVTNSVLEIWSCNSTGVYSGIIARGNGVGTADPSNLNNTFLRGLQPTDDDGVAQFTTLFPGHYSGRATHIHVMVHFNGTTFDNGTYAGGYISHVGQFFFDQSLISRVEATGVYTSNTQRLTLNSADSILNQETANGHDPFVEYSLLSDNIEDGIFSWISFGVDLNSQQIRTGAAVLTGAGGVENANSGMGGGGGGSAPSGASPGGVTSTTTVTAGSGTTTASTSAAGSTLMRSVALNSTSVISTVLVLLLLTLGLLYGVV